LIDLSGSTRRVVAPGESESPTGSSGSRVIDIEKEGLLLLSEALQAIGDEYALFGFSGQSKDQVDFHLIKGFDEAYGRPVQEKILSIQPGGQNRDGAAIRHALYKLRQRNSRTRLLFLISDGRPLDKEYSGAYSQEDTRMALREARSWGIHPFCITVDQEAPEYIRSMYRELPYTVLSDLRALPQKLPRIYKRLTV
jgi:nitric oxide reductase activation protein